MPKFELENVVSHSHKLIENFETSPKDFYAAVEAGLERRQVPAYRTSRVDFTEGGALTAKREYLRIARGKAVFDICAAPYGTGFFFSSWVTQRRPRMLLLWAIGLVALCMLIRPALGLAIGPIWAMNWMQSRLLSDSFSAIVDVILWILDGFVALGAIAIAARAGFDDAERAMLELPIVGWVYRRIFAPETYYRIDTTLMFQSAVQSAMLEAINALLTKKGLRALGENDMRPVFRELVGGGEGNRRSRRLVQDEAIPSGVSA